MNLENNFGDPPEPMTSTLKSLRALSDPTRLRIVALLEKDELSVNELQEVTRLGQSRISTHLGLLATLLTASVSNMPANGGRPPRIATCWRSAHSSP